MTLFLFSIGSLLCWDNTLQSCSLRRKSALCSVRVFTTSQSTNVTKRIHHLFSFRWADIYCSAGDLQPLRVSPKRKEKKKIHVHACRGSLHSTVLFLEDITNVPQSVCAPSPSTKQHRKPHHQACQRQLILSSFFSSYSTTDQNMWPHRKSSQKPDDGLYAAFKLAHPHVGPGTQMATSEAPTLSTVSATGALSDPIMDHRCVDVFLYFGPFN